MSATVRLHLLRHAIRAHGGRWTTRRVQHLYRDHGYDAPQRSTARRDLERLCREGALTLHDHENDRYYLPKGTR